MVVIQSDHFGRMGHASVRYCRRESMKYFVGLQFSAPFELGDPVRRKILEGVLIKASQNKPPERETLPNDRAPGVNSQTLTVGANSCNRLGRPG